MKADELRALQSPVKKKYKANPSEAQQILHAEGTLGDGISCAVGTEIGKVEAGLHPATGGDGSLACSGDMLLQALVGCAGVTLQSVSTAMGIDIKEGTIHAKGLLDFRGTLGVAKEVPAGFKEITVSFELDTNADRQKLKKLIELTEQYCVVYQTLKNSLDTTSELVVE